MSDRLVVSGGGTVAVSTTVLGEQQGRLDTFVEELGRCRASTTSIDGFVDFTLIWALPTPPSPEALAALARAEQALSDAALMLGVAQKHTGALAEVLRRAALNYGTAEQLGSSLAQALSARSAYLAGRLTPYLVGPLSALAGVGGGITLGVGGLQGLSPQQLGEATLAWLAEHQQLLSDPRLVDAVRLAVVSTDEFGAGLLRIPPEIALLFGSESLGVLGLSSSAAVLTGLAGPFGVAKETPVEVKRSGTLKVSGPPADFAERARRIPTGEAQIRVERYTVPGEEDAFEVYLGGTKDGSLISGDNPWDMTSNLRALGLGDAGSMRAVQQALGEAGVTADSPVVFNGYSQGGLLALRLAQTGDYNTQGVFSIGGPNGQLGSADAPYLALEHREDLVAGSGGPQSSTEPVVVRRAVFEGGTVPPDELLPAHSLDRYRETAALLDETSDPRITEVRDALQGVAGAATGVVATEWTARRVVEPAPECVAPDPGPTVGGGKVGSVKSTLGEKAAR